MIFNEYIDIHYLFGFETRVPYKAIVGENVYNFFRFLGIYSEPHTYAVSILLLHMMTLNRGEIRKYHLLGSFSVIVSMSLWGAVVGVILPFVSAIWEHDRIIESIKSYVKQLVILTVAFFVLFGGALHKYDYIPALKDRIMLIFQDGSLKERYGNHTAQTDKTIKLNPTNVEGENKLDETLLSSQPIIEKIFGHGLSTYPFLQGLALNGFAFIQHAGGIFGSLFFVGLIVSYWRKASELNRLQKLSFLLLVILLMTSYPIITFASFWIFLSLIPLKNRKEKAC